ncbi:MAG: hypothetical protein JWQ09_3807 [Segetibacter sp.]|nr:hypothetical protein [Segetibacter sp.]
MRKNLHTPIIALLSVLSCFFQPLFSFAQVISEPLPLSKRIDESHFALSGKVSTQRCYEDEKGNIYTLNKIDVTAWFKNQMEHSDVYVITEGGIVGNKAQITEPAVQLQKGREYFLMLENDNTTHDDKKFRLANPSKIQAHIYSDEQGAMLLQNGYYYDKGNKKRLTEETLIREVQSLTNQKAKRPNGALYIAGPKKKTESVGSITSFSPNPAKAGIIDTADFLLIKGSGFGSVVGTVEFSNADDGGVTFITPPNTSDYVLWKDDSIKVKVPARAGTGKIRVNGSSISPDTLKISYAHTNINSDFSGFNSVTRQRYYLRNINGLGGYSFKYNTTSGFSANTAAKDAFERSLETWVCATGINWTADGSTTAVFASDDVNAVLFDASLPAGVLGRATSRFSASATGTCNQENTVWYLAEIDIQFKNPSAGFAWQFGPAAPSAQQYDFESVALHELGHAHGLGHRIASGEVMHFSLSNGISIRNPSTEEIAGGLKKMSYSTTATCFNPAGSGAPMRTGTCSLPVTVSSCSGGNALFVLPQSGTGSSYQWQVDSTTGYTNLNNNAIYSGVTNDTLKLTAVPSRYVQYKYRCIVTDGSVKDTSGVYTLSMMNAWTGNVNNVWENSSNWSCGVVPDEFTDVRVEGLKSNYPIISSNAACRSISMSTGTSLNITIGNSLNVSGKDFK